MDECDALLALQECDLKIARLTKQLDELPEKRAILSARAKLADIRTLLTRTEAYRRGVETEIKHIEDDTPALTHKMDVEQAKLTSGEITSPKELQAIAMELDSLRRRRDQLEQMELDQLAKREAAIGQSDKVRAALAQGEKNEAALVDDFKDKGSHLLGEIETLKAERAKLMKRMSAAVLERYEVLREAKHGIAVGRLEGETCGVCRVSIPQHTVETLRAGPAIGACPNCSRMLVIKEDES
jgi:uncharacterized protein